ncbi:MULTISPECIES: right-handed parallel beta-helix repeat-containing protein [Streptomyces]|uniref:Right-handed parallel beta-helix repeat-containing protein n=1 Tax=Streptomyces siderophoricus TaxID=2802281 RepID=A0ABS1MPJ7_9ACTN|nr:right-handed parallel beta-helix repeat-containing protein [Streptomyces sp. 9-7]MBL1089716.1 right-handed parallel beta-helix repeat-containing protein [Streptomyces sp. 9-7]
MALQQMTLLGCVAAVMAGGLGAAPPSDAPGRHVVRPGESIQQAVDAARPGDTVVLRPGIYRESVLITTSRLRLVGAGKKTVIRPSSKRAANRCGEEGNGICVLGSQHRPLRDVSIRALTVTGFKQNGIWASGTDRMTVYGVTSRKNGVWGIAQEKSTRGVIHDNFVTDNGDSGIFLANTVKEEGGATDTRGASITQNRMSRNRIGVTIRRVRNLTVGHNTVTGNCAGVFVVGDESRPRAGALTVRDNDVSRNNRHCAATKRLPFLQGSGIVLTGTERALVRHNLVRDNRGTSPLSGGVVLFHSFVGALNEHNTVVDNIVLRNKPVDLADRDPKGRGNRFIRNVCRTSKPAGLC